MGVLLSLSLLGLGGCSSSDSSSEVSSSASSSSSIPSAGTVAELTFNRLYELADFPVGTAVSAGTEEFSIFSSDPDIGQPQRDLIKQHFSQVTPGNIMKMNYLHNQYGTFTYDNANELIDWAKSFGAGVHAHTFIWHRDYQIPQWWNQAVAAGESAEQLQERLDYHVTEIASYFSGKVDSWDVVNEVIANENGQWGYRNSTFFQQLGADYIERAFIAARAADPHADLYYNDYNISPGGGKFQFMLEMIDDFLERDIPIDGVGFQMHVHMGWPSIDAISASFQEIVDRELKVKITELDIPINNPFDDNYSYPDNYQSTFTPAVAERQKRRYCQIVEAYMTVVPEELRGGITVWGVYDGDTWLISEIFNNNHDDWPLLFNKLFQPKPAAQGVGDGLMRHSC